MYSHDWTPMLTWNALNYVQSKTQVVGIMQQCKIHEKMLWIF
jgi:hypothetical protein